MYVRVGADEHELVDPWELKSLSVKSNLRLEDLAEVLQKTDLGSVSEDSEHVWLDVVTLSEQIPEADRSRWMESFGKVLDFAEQHGWVRNNRSQVRAHIEGESSA